MRQIGDLNGLVGLQRHTALIEMGLRNHQFGNGFWVSNNQQGFPIARLFLIGRCDMCCHLGQHLSAQDAVGGVALTIFHGTPIARRKEKGFVGQRLRNAI